jgi:hypothetical protein
MTSSDKGSLRSAVLFLGAAKVGLLEAYRDELFQAELSEPLVVRKRQAEWWLKCMDAEVAYCADPTDERIIRAGRCFGYHLLLKESRFYGVVTDSLISLGIDLKSLQDWQSLSEPERKLIEEAILDGFRGLHLEHDVAEEFVRMCGSWQEAREALEHYYAGENGSIQDLRDLLQQLESRSRSGVTHVQ